MLWSFCLQIFDGLSIINSPRTWLFVKQEHMMAPSSLPETTPAEELR